MCGDRAGANLKTMGLDSLTLDVTNHPRGRARVSSSWRMACETHASPSPKARQGVLSWHPVTGSKSRERRAFNSTAHRKQLKSEAWMQSGCSQRASPKVGGSHLSIIGGGPRTHGADRIMFDCICLDSYRRSHCGPLVQMKETRWMMALVTRIRELVRLLPVSKVASTLLME